MDGKEIATACRAATVMTVSTAIGWEIYRFGEPKVIANQPASPSRSTKLTVEAVANQYANDPTEALYAYHLTGCDAGRQLFVLCSSVSYFKKLHITTYLLSPTRTAYWVWEVYLYQTPLTSSGCIASLSLCMLYCVCFCFYSYISHTAHGSPAHCFSELYSIR